ncbi:Dicarboxylate/amino acid:cation symporter family protein [Candidatus Hepatincolaceae symbiont of Richtersius coronifer]
MVLRFWGSSLNIFIFAIIGVIAGLAFGEKVIFLKPIGDIFIQLIRMLIVPVVMFSILNSTSQLANTNNAGKVSFFGFLYFFVTSVAAGVLGIMFAKIFNVGLGLQGVPASLLTGDQLYSSPEIAKQPSFWEFIINIIPSNPIAALVQGNILQIITFFAFLGVAISYLKNDYKDNLLQSINVLNEALLWIMSKVMLITPLAVLSLIAYATGTLGLEILFLTLKFLFIFLLGCIFLVYGVFGLIMKYFSNVPYRTFVKKIIPLQIISFTTASSLVSLPTNLMVCDRLKLNKNISNFILPIGATVNMNGNAMYFSMSAIFFAHMFNIDITFTGYIAIVLASILGAIGTSGVPGPSLLIVAVLVVINVPLAGLPLLFAVDRIFDMIRTSINVVGDTTCVGVLDKYLGYNSQDVAKATYID